MEPIKNSHTTRIALLIAFASILQIGESLIPHPIPGIRFGLANMITLVALIQLGYKPALEIAVLRTLLSSFILGTFMSPSFLLSFCGSLISTIVMILTHYISTRGRLALLSIVGISVLGSLTHNLVQIGLVYAVFIRQESIFFMLPWIGISSVLMGWLTGFVAMKVCWQLEQAPQKTVITGDNLLGSSFKVAQNAIPDSPVSRLAPDLKLIMVLILSLAIVLMNNIYILLGIGLLLTVIIIVARLSLTLFLKRFLKLSSIILFAFFLPVLTNNGGELLLQWGPLQVTVLGLSSGIVFSLRIMLLMTMSMILTQTTAPPVFIESFRRFLYPFKLFGISEKHVSEVLIRSWTALPYYWDIIRDTIKLRNSGKKKFMKIVPVLTDVITELYIWSDEAGETTNFKEK